MKSKFFRVATEGDTTDGREIQRSWLEQIAKNYNQDKYGARVWLEHIRGLSPDSQFRAYGDVVAVKTEENDEGKLVLLAQIEPTESLIKLNKEKQKIYSSIEVNSNFANTGEAYLVGMAVTDSPASLGTEMLQFSANAKNNPLAARKQDPNNLFSAAVEFNFEVEEEPAPEKPQGSTLLSKVKDLLTKHKNAANNDFSEVHAAVEEVAKKAGELSDGYSELQKKLGELETQYKELKSEHEQTSSAFTELKSQLDSEPAGPQRQPASGGNGTAATDC